MTMTREVELYKAADNFSEDHKYEEDLDYVSLKMAFIEGAEWADEHSVNVWHDASEEPLGEWNIVIFDTYGEFFSYTKEEANYMYEEEQGWKSFIKRVALIKWAYIDDLLLKEENK